ncbi:MAG: CAP domain-containing protein [Patescibacteria group bacterium]
MKKNTKNTAYFLFGFFITVLIVSLFRAIHISTKELSTNLLSRTNVVELTNDSRRSQRLKLLKNSKKLAAAAQKKAEDMLKNQYFDHVSPTGKKAWDFMNETKYLYLYAGENLALNYTSPQAVTEGWMASPTHRANILSPDYTEIGVGSVHGKYRGVDATFIVQMFGKPLSGGILR